MCAHNGGPEPPGVVDLLGGQPRPAVLVSAYFCRRWTMPPRHAFGLMAGRILARSCEYTEMKDNRFNVFLRRQARLPLAGGIRRCPGFRNFRVTLVVFGDHLAACSSTGRLRRRGTAFERVYRPLWKESTARERVQLSS